MILFWIQDFYTYALGIPAEKLSSLTWYDVLKKLCEAQSKLQLSVNNQQLNPIDIYHRILRAKNYMVAMINQVSFSFFDRVLILLADPATSLQCAFDRKSCISSKWIEVQLEQVPLQIVSTL